MNLLPLFHNIEITTRPDNNKGETQMNGFFERTFKLKEHNTNVRTEIMAGITTFMTMVYILVINPNILSSAGMDRGAVFTATALSAAIATIDGI